MILKVYLVFLKVFVLRFLDVFSVVLVWFLVVFEWFRSVKVHDLQAKLVYASWG